MKVYLYKRNEIFIVESTLQEERLADSYNELFNEILLFRNISDKKIFQSINIINNKITSTPHIVQVLLFQQILPAFKFLVGKN